MNLKKLLALLLALVLALSLVACKKDDNTNDANGTNDTEDNDSSDTVAVEVGFFDAEGNKLMSENDTFLTINSLEVPFDEYRYLYQQIDYNYFSGGNAAYWETYAAMLPTLQEYTEYYILEANWARLLAEEYDITLTEEDLATVDEYMAQQAASFESEEVYQSALKAAGYSEDLFRRLITADVLSERVYQELYAKEGALLTPSDDELKAQLAEDYVRVHHVLISFDHFADAEGYEDATEDVLKQAALDLANSTLADIQAGADIYELAQTVGDDPGMVENEAGYLFTYGKMVEPFETASFALEVGGLSGLVETDYGYHIILRLEQENYVNENWDTVRTTIIEDIFNTQINEMLEDAEIVYNEYYKDMTATSIK